MTQSEKQKWEKIRAKGRTNYILFNGILRIGILTGVITASVPCLFGYDTGAFKMSIWTFFILVTVLTFVFGIGFGALFWHLIEKNYNTPTTDDHVSSLQSITKTELQDINRKLLRRQNRRKLFLLPLLIFIFLALSLIPHSSPYRVYYGLGVGITAWILFILFLRFEARMLKADCNEFGAMCPKCNKPLFSLGASINKGRCPRCGYQLFDDTVAK